MINIGNEYKYTGNHPEYKTKIVHCIDTDAINQQAKISIPDINGLCWDLAWVDFKDLEDVNGDRTNGRNNEMHCNIV